jgi:threonine synthase
MTRPGVASGDRGIIRRYFDHLDVSATTPIVTLGEGNTPLIRSEALSRQVEGDVWLKYEGLNPTGSFKDRGMTVAVSKALEAGAGAIVCASTGNTSASAAAYAAKAGLSCAVLVPAGNVATGKLAQAIAHGAKLIEIEGNFDIALKLTQEISEQKPVTLVNSVNPFRIEGQKTAAFEIVESLEKAPDLHFMPVGNAGNITAYWRGYREALATGWGATLPKMFGFQAVGADPIVRGHPIEDPQTIASAIRIGKPASWDSALEAARDSGGAIDSVGDKAIASAWRVLAEEGVFVELAAAAGVAGLLGMAARGVVAPDSTIVCVLTGHGLKDTEWVLDSNVRPHRLPARIESVIEVLDLD